MDIIINRSGNFEIEDKNVIPKIYKKVDKILHIFDLHACDLPEFYSNRSQIKRLRERFDYTPMPDIYHFIDK